MANEVKEPLKLYFHENTAEQASMLNTMVTNVLNDMGITSIQEEVVENAVSDYLTKHPVHDGEKGDKGDTGTTPIISASATVSQTVGTSTVSVEKSGTDENPNFSFAFSGIKGEKGDKGDDGLDGFANRLDNAEYTDNDYIAIDDGTKARKIRAIDLLPDISEEKDLAYFSNKTFTSDTRNGITFTKVGNAVHTVGHLTNENSNANFMAKRFIPKKSGKYLINHGFIPYNNLNTIGAMHLIAIYYDKNGQRGNNVTLFTANSKYYILNIPSIDDIGYIELQIWINKFKEDIDQIWTINVYPYEVANDYSENKIASNYALTERVTTLENKKYLDIPSISTKDVNIAHDKKGLYADTFNWDSPNLPFTTNSDVITFQGNNNNYSQIAISKTSDKGQLYIRTMNGGTWGSWKWLVTADELTALANRVTALENK